MKGRIVGVDYGLKRIGLAVSDAMGILASPWGLIECGRTHKTTTERLQAALDQISKERGAPIVRLVIGLPLMMNGTTGSQATLVNEFVAHLKTQLTIEIVTWDERLTTTQAERSMREAGLSRLQRKGLVDRAAAAILLQSYLDAADKKWTMDEMD